MELNEKQWAKLSDVFVDLGKYVLTAVLFGFFISNGTVATIWCAISFIFGLLLIAIGISILGITKETPPQKKGK